MITFFFCNSVAAYLFCQQAATSVMDYNHSWQPWLILNRLILCTHSLNVNIVQLYTWGSSHSRMIHPPTIPWSWWRDDWSARDNDNASRDVVPSLSVWAPSCAAVDSPTPEACMTVAVSMSSVSLAVAAALQQRFGRSEVSRHSLRTCIECRQDISAVGTWTV